MSTTTRIAKAGREFAHGPVKRIHVDQGAVKTGDPLCVSIQCQDGPFRCQKVRIRGESTLEADFANPLPCGTRVWLTTHAEVEVLA